MTLEQLTELARLGGIHSLELISLEGGIYLLHALTAEGPQRLLDEQGNSLRFRSTTHLRDFLRSLPSLPCELVQQVVHDEMCGSRSGPIAPLRLAFTSTEPW